LILLGFVAGYIPEPYLSGRALESGSFLSVASCPDTPGTPAPEKITLDGYAASHGAVVELQDEGVLLPRLLVRTNRYLHNLIEQDHRKVKQRVRPMLGFKCFAQAAITLSGIA
jgi:DDE domain